MSDTIKDCPFCGEEIKAEAIKCKHCKSDLPKEERRNIDTISTRSSSGNHDDVYSTSSAAKPDDKGKGCASGCGCFVIILISLMIIIGILSNIMNSGF